MQFFTDDYKGNDPVKDYWALFARIKKHLRPEIAEIFSSGTMHDSKIVSLTLVDVPDAQKHTVRHDVLLEIENDTYKGVWRHVNVTRFSLSELDFSTFSWMEYLYGEILWQKKKIIHNFTCWPLESEIFIECDDILWENAGA
jgi:hypothetical protein